MRINQLIVTVALTGLALALTGCLVVPIPEAGRKVTADWKAQAARLQAERATREEVTRQLGSPAWDFPDLQVIGYHWVGVEWAAFWLASGAGAADSGICEPTTHRLLWLYFDDQDRLARYKLTQFPLIETRTKWECARRWRESFSPLPPATTD